MNEFNSTRFFLLARVFMLFLVFSLANLTQASAQECTCKGTLQVSLDSNCEALIRAIDLLASSSTCGTGWEVTLMKSATGGIIAGPALDQVILPDGVLYVGKSIYAKVTNTTTKNSCWTLLNIEDKLKPYFDPLCSKDTILTCPQMASYVPTALDNCGAATAFLVSESILVNDCRNPAVFAGPDTLKRIIRTWKAKDKHGLISDSVCLDTIWLVALEREAIQIPKNITLQCDENYATILDGIYKGNPSPYVIAGRRGSGTPSISLPNTATWTGTKSGTGANTSQTSTALTMVSGTTATGTAQLCLTMPSSGNVTFTVNVAGSGGDTTFATINGARVSNLPIGYYDSAGLHGPDPDTICVAEGDRFCFVIKSGVNAASSTLTITDLKVPVSLYPNADAFCNLFVSFSDVVFPKIKCTTKIMRTWQVIEWSCDSSIETYTQLIEITDSKGPVITGLKDEVVTTNGHSCVGLYKVLKPVITDNCSTDIKYTVTVKDSSGAEVAFYPAVRLSDPDRYINLPSGCNKLIFNALDDCHNHSIDSINVRVEDNTPPVAICKLNTVVGLTENGKAWVPSSSFDNGSYDECELAKVLVRRMNPAPCQPCKTPIIPGFTYLGEYKQTTDANAHHYYISKHRATPRVAMKTAAAIGGYAVTVNNAVEGTWLHGKVKDWKLAEDYLIGLRDLVGAGTYTWAGGQSAAYRNWDSGYPVVGQPWTIVKDLTEGPDGKWRTAISENCNASEWLYVVEIEDVCGFSEYVEFCCADVNPSNTPQVVVLRAIDKAGNWNECMVNAIVQDKLPPSIVCPPDQTLHCSDLFEVTKAGLRAKFGYATAIDNCSAPEVTDTFFTDLTSCRIGTITREFSITDAGRNVRKCTQVIRVVGGSNFAPTSFPADVIINACADPESDSFSPDSLGKPNLGGDNICSLVGSKYTDDVYYINNSTGEACFKIIRNWTVIDWCKFYPNTYIDTKGTTSVADDEVKTYPAFNYDGSDITTKASEYDDRRNRINTWRSIQIIKVVDKEKPVIAPCPTKTVCSYDPACAGGYIELGSSATDQCTDELRYSWKVDLNNNGSFDNSTPGLTLSGSGLSNSINASGTYPIGTHRIVYSFEDRCGNLSVCEQIFTIKNCKAPTPYCLNGLATSLMPVDSDKDGVVDGGMVDIWASDFNNGSSHPCPGYSVVASFRRVTANTDGTPNIQRGRTYTCDSLGRRDVVVYFAAVDPNGKVVLNDLNQVVQDYCSTFITIQDNFRSCSGGTGRLTVNGSLTTEGQIPVKDVSVSLEGGEKVSMSTNSGTYNFTEIQRGGNYIVKPYKNNDPMNGVSTIDLVLIQKHILGIEKISSPYKLIAADINKDQKITASDLIELRKLILGVVDKFSNNNSWRFVDKAYGFRDAANAYAESFPEVYNISNMSSDMQVNFTSVKVGDVNGNVVANSNSVNTESRSAQKLTLAVDNKSFNAGQTIEIPVTIEKATEITGFQFTVGFDTEKFSLESVNSGLAGMTDNNFGFQALANGKLTVSYNKDNAIALNNGDNVITLTFKAKTNGTVENALELNSSITHAEAYNASNDVMDVELNVSNRTAEPIVLHQNTPNPFKSASIIGFNLPADMNATLTVYDVTGKKVKVFNQQFHKGYNSVEVNKNELGSTGVMYYTLEAGDFKATKKMVIIE
jgi:hypothetical protein